MKISVRPPGNMKVIALAEIRLRPIPFTFFPITFYFFLVHASRRVSYVNRQNGNNYAVVTTKLEYSLKNLRVPKL